MENNIKLLRKEAYAKLIEKLAAQKQVYAPVRQGKRIGYGRITSLSEMVDDYILPHMSVKSFVFPRIEKLFGYTKDKNEVEVHDINPDLIHHKVVFGVRPCDAMGIDSLSSIFEWDPADTIFELRKERTTVVAYACSKADDYCFCTSVGGSPGSTKGCDMLLTKTDSGDYIAEIVTPKGEAIVSIAPELFEESAGLDKEKFLAQVPEKFNLEHLKGNINKAFDTAHFDQYAIRCLGCGACAYVCPTCACFDIQDETKGSRGIRTRNWDSCGMKLFTLHTSGHNPRETQGARWRQRLMHKFSYMPERLDTLGCVGCGRCSRSCPVDMNLPQGLKIIAESKFE